MLRTASSVELPCVAFFTRRGMAVLTVMPVVSIALKLTRFGVGQTLRRIRT